MQFFNEEKENLFDVKAKSGFFAIIFKIIKFILLFVILLFIIFISWVIIKNPLNVRSIIFSKIGIERAELIEEEEREEEMGEVLENDSLEVEEIVVTEPQKTMEAKESEIKGINIENIITEEQKVILEKVGIDSAQLPPITPEMEECFKDKFTNERIEEFVNGATPGPIEIIKASSCL